jgi:hypothetical protein
MRGLWRLAAGVVGVAACLAAGCGFAQKPYAGDPLLRGGRAVWLSRDVTPPSEPPPEASIEPPRPPGPAPTSPRWE